MLGERGVVQSIRQAETNPLEKRRELTGLLVTLAGLRLQRGIVLANVRRNPMLNELFRESSVAEEFIEEGARWATRLALQGRFPALDQDVLTAIERADEATLEAVLLHATSDALDQFHAPAIGRPLAHTLCRPAAKSGV